MKRDKLNILFRILIGLCVIGIIFIAVYNSFSSMDNFVVLFWALVIMIIILKVLQAVVFEKMNIEFVEIEEIENNDENVLDKIVKGLGLSSKEEIVTDEKFTLATYTNKIAGKGLVYVKADVINDARMLVLKNHLDEYGKKYKGNQIYVLLDVVTYTREVEVMLNQFTVFTDKYRIFNLGLPNMDTKILVLSKSLKDKKFRIGGMTYKYNISDFRKMKKQIKKIVIK